MTDEELLKEMEKRAEAYNDRIKRDFAIEELEKIKAEIEKLEYQDFDCNLVLPAWKVYDIIDSYIEELKGESK